MMRAHLLGAVAGMLCGCLLAFAAHGAYMARQEHTGETAALIAREQELTKQQNELRLTVDALGRELAAAGSDESIANLLGELASVREQSGLTDMRGPGVEVVLDDAPSDAIRPGEDINAYIVHDVDVLRVVNMLRAAGAECVSINGERLLSTSRIRCGGPTIRVRERPLAAPFVISAIGDAQAMSDILTARAPDGGMSELEILRFFGVRAEVRRVKEITVPRYRDELSYRYAKVVD